MDQWTEIPAAVGKADTQRSAVAPELRRGLLLSFLEKRLWTDADIRRTTCWIYPSGAMIEHRAVVFKAAERSFLINIRQMRERLSTCASSSNFVVFIVKFAIAAIGADTEGASYYLVLLDRGTRTGEVLWIDGDPLPASRSSQQPSKDWMTLDRVSDFVRLNVIAQLFSDASKWRVFPVLSAQVCTIKSGQKQAEWECALTEAAYMYLRLLNPGRSREAVIRHLSDRCIATMPSKEGLCGYLLGFWNTVQSVMRLPPFRNVPLAQIADLSSVRKFSQSYASMDLFLQHVAFRLNQQKLVCVQDIGDVSADQPFQVLDPALLKKTPTLTSYVRAPASALRSVATCSARFYMAGLAIRDARTTPAEIAEGQKLAAAGGWSPLEIVSTGHQNALLFDRNRRLLFRYEPHGSPETAEEEAKSAWVDDFVRDRILTPLNAMLPPERRYRYETMLSVCPYIAGAQRIEAAASRTEGGYCVVYATMFLILVLLNPDWPLEDILARMANAGLERIEVGRPGSSFAEKARARGELMRQYIVKFMLAMDCVIPPVIGTAQPATRMAILRNLRRNGVLAPISCAETRWEELNRIIYFDGGGGAKGSHAPVFLAARSACGIWIVRSLKDGGALLNMANQVSAVSLRSLTGPDLLFQRFEQGSPEAQRWISLAKGSIPTSGVLGSRERPLILDAKNDSGRLAIAIAAAVEFYSSTRKEPLATCPSTRIIKVA